MLTNLHRKLGFPGIYGLDDEGREVSIPDESGNPEDEWNADYAALVAGDLLPPEPVIDLLAYAADLRWRKEVGGITIGGVPVATDDRSKIMIMGARVAAAANEDWETVWHGSDGQTYPLNAARMIAISNAVEAHVNATFATLASVKADIEAGNIATIAGIDGAFDV